MSSSNIVVKGTRLERGRGETGAAGSEEGRWRVRSERRGPDIRRSLVVVRDPVCQSAGRGEMRRHRSRRDLPDDPEPRVGRHTRRSQSLFPSMDASLKRREQGRPQSWWDTSIAIGWRPLARGTSETYWTRCLSQSMRTRSR